MSSRVIYTCDRCKTDIVGDRDHDPLKYTVKYTIKNGESFQKQDDYQLYSRRGYSYAPTYTTVYRDKVIELNICEECSLIVDKCLTLNQRRMQDLHG